MSQRTRLSQKIIDRLLVRQVSHGQCGSVSISVREQFQVCKVTSLPHLWNIRGTRALGAECVSAFVGQRYRLIDNNVEGRKIASLLFKSNIGYLFVCKVIKLFINYQLQLHTQLRSFQQLLEKRKTQQTNNSK